MQVGMLINLKDKIKGQFLGRHMDHLTDSKNCLAVPGWEGPIYWQGGCSNGKDGESLIVFESNSLESNSLWYL